MKGSQAVIDANRQTNQRVRQKSLDTYYENPNFCGNCGKLIEVRENEAVSAVRKKLYCSHSCAAIKNNTGVNRWGTRPAFSTIQSSLPCEKCGAEIELTPRKRKSGTRTQYFVRRFCKDCLTKDLIDGKLTKAELRQKHKKFGHHGFRGTLNRHANRIYNRSGQPRRCKICGFDICVEICHIKDVAKFPETALIEEINSINNLVALCPNHHVMFDKGLITI